MKFTNPLTDQERLDLIKASKEKAAESRKWKNRPAEWCQKQREAIKKRSEKRKCRKPKTIKSLKAHLHGIKYKDEWLKRSYMGSAASAKKVICLDDNTVHDSASAAGRYYNIARSSIIELCLGKNGRKTVGGRKFRYLES